MLFPIINNKSAIHKNCSILIYKKILLPLITYADPIWENCSVTYFKKIQIIQNKILRIITNVLWFIRNENIHEYLQINKILNHILARSKNVHNILLNSTGSLHYNLHIHAPLQRRLKHGRPHDFIN